MCYGGKFSKCEDERGNGMRTGTDSHNLAYLDGIKGKVKRRECISSLLTPKFSQRPTTLSNVACALAVTIADKPLYLAGGGGG